MQFHHYMNLHVASRITGPRHNYLAITFATEEHSEEPTIIGLPPQGGCEHRPLDAAKVLENTPLGVADGNASVGTHYRVRNVQYVTNDTGPEGVYREMARRIVEDARRQSDESRLASEKPGAKHEGFATKRNANDESS
jgi:hypothetical protein